MNQEILLKPEWKEGKARLTVSPNRWSMKLSENTIAPKRLKQILFFHKVIDYLREQDDFTNTMRGNLHMIENKYEITLYNGSKTQTIKYSYENS